MRVCLSLLFRRLHWADAKLAQQVREEARGERGQANNRHVVGPRDRPVTVAEHW